ncbi:MAG TPA: ABC transporter C-terminal domain-containing protein, partial [Clostridium sp.]
KVIHKILELNKDGLKEYLGNYSYYIEKKKNPLRFQAEEDQVGMSKTQVNLDKKKKRDNDKLEKQKKIDLKTLEDKISSMEQELEKLNNDLCLEEVYSSPSRSVETNSQISSTKAELETLYANWEYFLAEIE